MTTMTLSDLGLRVFYVPGQIGGIDVAFPDDSGVLRGQYSGDTLEEIRVRYPGAIEGDIEQVAKASHDLCRRPAQRITEERYTEMLECLPPMDWTGRDGWQTFKMSERNYGTITGIYAWDRTNDVHYTLADDETLTHEQIVAACKALT
jgi:hypothetical protein